MYMGVSAFVCICSNCDRSMSYIRSLRHTAVVLLFTFSMPNTNWTCMFMCAFHMTVSVTDETPSCFSRSLML